MKVQQNEEIDLNGCTYQVLISSAVYSTVGIGVPLKKGAVSCKYVKNSSFYGTEVTDRIY